MNIEDFVYSLGYRVTEEGKLINPKGKVINGSIRHKNRKYSTLSFNIKFGEKKKNISAAVSDRLIADARLCTQCSRVRSYFLTSYHNIKRFYA